MELIFCLLTSDPWLFNNIHIRMNNLLASANYYLAQTINVGDPSKLSGFENATNLRVETMVSGAVGLLLVVAGLAFFFILVIGGIKWIVSGGDKAHTEAARGQITAALVGLVIVFSAWAIIALIKSFFNVDLLKLTIPQGY